MLACGANEWRASARPKGDRRGVPRCSGATEDHTAIPWGELSALIDECARLVLVRHRGVHGILMIDPTLPPEEQWITRRPGEGEHAITAFATAATSAIADLHAISERASRLRELAFRRASKRERTARTNHIPGR